jgi:hypothetical protein
MKKLITITTKDKPETLKLCLNQIEINKFYNEFVYIYDDGSNKENRKINKELADLHGFIYEFGENKGIAFAKNKCLEFANKTKAEYVLLLDDDCFPKKIGYFVYLIQTAEKHNENYFVLCEGKFKDMQSVKYDLIETDEIKSFSYTFGVLQYLTRKVICSGLKFDTDFKVYGSEHILFMNSIVKNKLSNFYTVKNVNQKINMNLQPTYLTDYFHSLDLHGSYLGFELKENSISQDKKDYWSNKNANLLKQKLKI